MTWLIAEDEADIRNLIALMCQMWGHPTLTFENGQRVWDWLDKLEAEKDGEAEAEKAKPQELPDLILMDIRMPGKRGNELAHRMRSMDALKQKPIVLMTAYTLSDDERKDMMTQDGVDQIINKPLPDFDQLRVILHNILDQKQALHDKPAE